MSDGAKKSVTIRVDASIWDSVDGNRSEICRQALQSQAQMERGVMDISGLAEDYNDAVEDERTARAEKEVKLQMIANELESNDYDEFILNEDYGTDATQFQRMIAEESRYANSCLDSGMTEGETRQEIMEDAISEGYRLPRAVAVWIIQEVQDQLDDE